MNAVIKAVNRAYDRVETRPFWKTRLIAIVLVVLTGLVLAGLFLLIVFGGPLGKRSPTRPDLGGAFELVWAIAPLADRVRRDPALLRARLLPRAERRRAQLEVAHARLARRRRSSWLALSGLFALYTSFSDSYSKTYGSLASGIILLLWLNYSAFALLFGAELNAELDRQADIRAAGGENAGPGQAERGAPRSTLTEPLTRLRARVGAEAERPRPRADLPRHRARARRGRSCGSRPVPTGGSCAASSGRER